MWISNKKFIVENMFCSAALWRLWKLRNCLCFQGTKWKSGQVLLLKVTAMIQSWSLLCPKEKQGGVLCSAGQAERHLVKTPPDYLLNQVSNKWERLLFQSAHNWRCSSFPEEAGYLLADVANLEPAVREKKWLNLSTFGDAWKMQFEWWCLLSVLSG